MPSAGQVEFARRALASFLSKSAFHNFPVITSTDANEGLESEEGYFYLVGLWYPESCYERSRTV